MLTGSQEVPMYLFIYFFKINKQTNTLKTWNNCPYINNMNKNIIYRKQNNFALKRVKVAQKAEKDHQIKIEILKIKTVYEGLNMKFFSWSMED